MLRTLIDEVERVAGVVKVRVATSPGRACRPTPACRALPHRLSLRPPTRRCRCYASKPLARLPVARTTAQPHAGGAWRHGGDDARVTCWLLGQLCPSSLGSRGHSANNLGRGRRQWAGALGAVTPTNSCSDKGRPTATGSQLSFRLPGIPGWRWCLAYGYGRRRPGQGPCGV